MKILPVQHLSNSLLKFPKMECSIDQHIPKNTLENLTKNCLNSIKNCLFDGNYLYEENTKYKTGIMPARFKKNS